MTLVRDPTRIGYERISMPWDRCLTPWYFVRWPCRVCGALTEKDYHGFPVDIQTTINGGHWLCLKCLQLELPF